MQHSLHVQTHPDVNLHCTGPESILSDEVKEKMSLYRSTLATCPFVSYGLSETGVGARTFLLRELSNDGLLLQLREEWMEYGDSNMKVHWVWPQPQGDTPGFHIIVEFLLGDELPHPSIEPALEETTILSIHGRPDVQRTALYHQRRLHNVDITRPFYDVCHRAQYVCVTRVLGKILPLSWARNTFAGALVQLFAHPPSLQITQEYYFDRTQPFFADSLAMWAEVHLPTISWQFHLLLPEGYRGVMETTASINSATSVAMVADRAFAHWGMDLPGALVYAGLSSHASTTQHFIAYDPEACGIPCLVQAEIDESLGIPAPPMIAVSLSSTCTIQEVIAAINAVWIFDLVGVEVTVFDGTLVFDSEDRFRPRHGTSYVVQVRSRAHDEVLAEHDMPRTFETLVQVVLLMLPAEVVVLHKRIHLYLVFMSLNLKVILRVMMTLTKTQIPMMMMLFLKTWHITQPTYIIYKMITSECSSTMIARIRSWNKSAITGVWTSESSQQYTM